MSRIPIEPVDIDKLPQEEPLKYDEISRLVGSLYIDTHHRMRIIGEQAKSLVQTLQNRINGLLEENSRLKEELQREKHEGGISTQFGVKNKTPENNNGSSEM